MDDTDNIRELIDPIRKIRVILRGSLFLSLFFLALSFFEAYFLKVVDFAIYDLLLGGLILVTMLLFMIVQTLLKILEVNGDVEVIEKRGND